MAEAQLTNQLSRIDSMTNVELRAELKRRGCPTSGNKKDLLAKLRVALQKEYEQAGLDTASTTPTMDSMSMDGRNHNLSHLQQSPVVQYDANRSSLNNSSVSSNNYMTPHGGSPVVYAQHMHPGEVPLTYSNLQIHDQTAGHYPPVYNLTMHQNPHQPPAPMVPVPQQLTITPTERHHMYDPSLLHHQQQQQQQQQQLPPQYSPMNTRQQRISVDQSMPTQISPSIPQPVPEKKTRTRSKKPSTDTPPVEILAHQIPINVDPSMVNFLPEIIDPMPVQQTIDNEQFVINASADVNNGNNNEVNSFVSKSIEDEQKDIEKLRPDRGDSRSPSVGSSSAKSESVIKEIPLSGERHRLSRSKSPKSRWHHSPSPHEQQQAEQSAAIEETQNSAKTTADAKPNGSNEQQNDKTSTVPSLAEKRDDLGVGANKQETTKTETSSPVEPEKAAAQQQLKPSRSQTSTPSSLMKGLTRSTASNRVNLSSDVLKTLIPDISLAPESLISDELEGSTNEQGNGDDHDLSSDQPMLETSVGSGFLLSDPVTIGDLADQKQLRHRTVVIDVAADSSSLNDDLVGNGLDNRRKNLAPLRVASYESKALIDGKTNALMMDEPVRVKDATTALDPPSRILYVRGLTRPFTLPLLKELLGRYGSLVDGELWLDKIKSQCFAIYNTIEDAQNARENLDGCRWPSTNPKTLSVRFARQEEFDFSKAHDLPPDQMSIDTMDISSGRLVQEKLPPVNKASASTNPDDEPKSSNKKLRPTGNNDVREWDIPKLQQEKEKSSSERQVIEEPAAKANEPPAKGLDDYFRKTKAKPAIYWLPLTDEQIVERTRRQEQRNAERDEEQRKREADETARSSNSKKDSKSAPHNNNENTSSKPSQRRSPSPREKRRRLSSSRSPPPRRDNKRH